MESGQRECHGASPEIWAHALPSGNLDQGTLPYLQSPVLAAPGLRHGDHRVNQAKYKQLISILTRGTRPGHVQ